MPPPVSVEARAAPVHQHDDGHVSSHGGDDDDERNAEEERTLLSR